MKRISKKCSIEVIEIYKQYPFLIPYHDYKFWKGFLCINGETVFIKIGLPNFPSTKNLSVDCDLVDQVRLLKIKDAILKNSTFLGVLNTIEFSLKASSNVHSERRLWDKGCLLKNQEILTELKPVQDYVSDINFTQNWVEFKYIDDQNHTHKMKVQIPDKYPDLPLKVIEVDLPTDVLGAFSQVFNLLDILSTFKETVDSLQSFWVILQEIYEEVWIIDPVELKRRDVHVRVQLDDTLSVVLTFNPTSPLLCPDAKFLGSLQAVNDARTSYESNMQKNGWDTELSVIQNLKRLFEVDSFPKKPNKSLVNTQEQHCGICLCGASEDESPPAKWCTNDKCTTLYHYDCLKQWVKSCANDDPWLDHVTGKCPYCHQKFWFPLQNHSEQS